MIMLFTNMYMYMYITLYKLNMFCHLWHNFYTFRIADLSSRFHRKLFEKQFLHCVCRRVKLKKYRVSLD